jgi:hypothetical protein
MGAERDGELVRQTRSKRCCFSGLSGEFQGQVCRDDFSFLRKMSIFPGFFRLSGQIALAVALYFVLLPRSNG